MSVLQEVTVESEGITLAKLIWRMLRRQPAGYVEIVLEANPGLADLGVVIPVGTKVLFPMDEVPSSVPVRNVVKLWD